MKFAFILGKNEELSAVELFSVLRLKNITFRLINKVSKIILLEIDSDEFEPSQFIEELGGLVRIVKIYDSLDYFDDQLLTNLDIYFINDFNYSFININLLKEEEQSLKASFKDFFKKNKFKAQLKSSEYSSKDNVSDPAKFFSWKLNEGFEFFTMKLASVYYYGVTDACTNAKKYVFLDENRPQRLFTHGTSFRLAQIMINLLQLKSGSTLVDPFAGTGTFMIEGLLHGLNVIGVDIDSDVLFAAKKNINWAKTTFANNQKHMLIHESSETADFNADACVFEPFMGPFLKNLPRYVEAENTVYMLTNIYTNLFKNLYKSLRQREKGLPSVVCILPEFKTREGKLLKPDYNKIFSSTGFKLMDLKEIDTSLNIKNPILYQTPEGNNIIRKLYVLERKTA